MTPGAPLAAEYKEENLELLEAGLPNLQRHIQSTAKFGVPCAINAIYLSSTDIDPIPCRPIPFRSLQRRLFVSLCLTLPLCCVASRHLLACVQGDRCGEQVR